MKIHEYNNWIDCPDGKVHSFKTFGSPKMYLDTRKYSPRKIIARMANICEDKWDKSGNLLVIITDKTGYENSLVGSPKQIRRFTIDCLADEGYMSKSWGRKK